MNTAMVFGVICAMVAIAGIAYYGGWENCRASMEKDAVANGKARFNPETKEFEWLE